MTIFSKYQTKDLIYFENKLYLKNNVSIIPQLLWRIEHFSYFEKPYKTFFSRIILISFARSMQNKRFSSFSLSV
jgi:hypothetical protein